MLVRWTHAREAASVQIIVFNRRNFSVSIIINANSAGDVQPCSMPLLLATATVAAYAGEHVGVKSIGSSATMAPSS